MGQLRTGREGDRRRVHSRRECVGRARARAAAEEFVLAGWRPELWSVDDLLNRTEAFTGSGDALDEVFRARLIATVGAARARQLLPAIARSSAGRPRRQCRPGSRRRGTASRGTPPFFSVSRAGNRRDGPAEAGHYRYTAAALRVPVVSGFSADRDPAAHSRSSFAAIFRSPQRARLERDRRDRAVAAGVAEGHNERIAWTADAIDVDTQDVYVETLNPSNPRQVKDAAAGSISPCARTGSPSAAARCRSTSSARRRDTV
jgi:hypothetical protein